MNKRVLIISIFSVIGIFIIILFGCEMLVSFNVKGRAYDDVSKIPYNKYGLLLATSPLTSEGRRNLHFENRIHAAEKLYKAGKINYIIASGGDYRQSEVHGYDEPASIRDSLKKRGIPEDHIILDYEGTRTLNSIVKTKEVYKIDSVTLISQEFHNERALYLADLYDLHAIAFNADPSPIVKNRIKNRIRETFARTKMFIDILTGEKADIKKTPIPVP